MSNLHVNENDSSQNGGCDFHVTIPAFKATPSSITRQSNSAYGSAGPSQQTSADVAAAIPNNPGSAVSSGSGHPHVPHEPYKGAVWSKPVRISHGRTSVRSTPRSSKAPSRSMSRTSISTCEANSSVWFERGIDWLINDYWCTRKRRMQHDRILKVKQSTPFRGYHHS